jgi:hypothetical protein
MFMGASTCCPRAGSALFDDAAIGLGRLTNESTVARASRTIEHAEAMLFSFY